MKSTLVRKTISKVIEVIIVSEGVRLPREIGYAKNFLIHNNSYLWNHDNLYKHKSMYLVNSPTLGSNLLHLHLKKFNFFSLVKHESR